MVGLFESTIAQFTALVPMVLRRIGQDPATASSIILTTVTDVVDYFSFLGIAALFAPVLAATVS